MIPPFAAMPSAGRMELVLLYRNCSGHPVTLQGVPDVHFFLSEAGAGNLEASGPAPVPPAFDFFTPGRPEDDRRAAPVVLAPGESAHVLLAYYDRGRHWLISSPAETRVKGNPSTCNAADVFTVNAPPFARLFRAPMQVCGNVYVSEYRRGNFTPGERISTEFLEGGPPDAPGAEITGPLVPSVALDRQTDIGLRACEAEDLDIGFDAPDLSIDPSSMVFHFRNIEARPCVTQPTPKVWFTDRQLHFADVQICLNCIDGQAVDLREGKLGVLLRPQDAAHVTLSFKAKSDQPSTCKGANGISFSAAEIYPTGPQTFASVYLGSRAIPICSRVDVSPVTLDSANDPPRPGSSGWVSLKLSSARSTYFDQEQISLHVEAEGPSSLLKLNDRGCLTFIQRSRSPDGFTRFDEVGAYASRCRVTTESFGLPDRKVEMDLDAGHLSRWSGRGEHATDVAYMAPPGQHEGAFLATSNTLHLTIADASLIPRNWGPQTKGVAVDVTLDKDTYELGEDVPLHLAVKNFAAEVAVYGAGFEMCNEIANVEVRDRADGLLVKRSDWGSPCAWSGPVLREGLAQYPLGQIVIQERTLRRDGWLPDYRGNFTVSATWTVYDCQVCNPQSTTPYAVAHSGPKAFRIIDSAHPQAASPLPDGILSPDLASRFEQVDTALGEKSALKDKTTGLKWLHLDITAGLSYNQVKAESAPGGRFAGWRYATLAELTEFFSHFDGAANGYSTDPKLEAQLQRNMGGPLAHPSNPGTGWHRSSSMALLDVPFDLGRGVFGYIADDSVGGSQIDPRLQGSSRENSGISGIGSYLVRPD